VIVLRDAENCTIASSFVWTKHQNMTGRHTDSPCHLCNKELLTYSLQRSALRAMRTRCKKVVKSKMGMLAESLTCCVFDVGLHTEWPTWVYWVDRLGGWVCVWMKQPHLRSTNCGPLT